jgi:hypothetical protein
MNDAWHRRSARTVIAVMVGLALAAGTRVEARRGLAAPPVAGAPGAFPLARFPAAQRSPRSCVPHGAKVVADSGLARAYRLRETLYACRGRLRVTLGPIASTSRTSSCVGDSVRIVRLVARFVAWSDDDECRDLVTWQIRVRALKSGMRTRTVLTGANACGDRCPRSGIGPARRLVLGTDGTVAWIARDEAVGTPTYEVWRVRAGGTPRRLARGADISPTYLKLEGDRAVWRQDGATHSR